MNPNFDKLPSLDNNLPGNTGEFGAVSPDINTGGPGEILKGAETPREHTATNNIGTAAPIFQPLATSAASPSVGVTTSLATTDDDRERDSTATDKAYVAKAKTIIKQTTSDPYRQSQQLSELKVSYKKQRYGAIINGGSN